MSGTVHRLSATLSHTNIEPRSSFFERRLALWAPSEFHDFWGRVFSAQSSEFHCFRPGLCELEMKDKDTGQGNSSVSVRRFIEQASMVAYPCPYEILLNFSV